MVQSTDITLISAVTTLSEIEDSYVVNAGTSVGITGYIITLPPIVSNGMNYKLTRVDQSLNIVTVVGDGLDQIIHDLGIIGSISNGITGGFILTPQTTVEFQSYESNWYVFQSIGSPGPIGPIGPTGPNFNNYVWAIRDGAAGSLVITSSGTIGTDIPLTDITMEDGGWALNGTGGIVVPETGVYQGECSITINWVGGLLGSSVSSVLKRNATPIIGTQVSIPQLGLNFTQLVARSCWIANLTAGDVLNPAALADLGGSSVASGSGLFPALNPLAVVTVVINRIQ